MFDERTGMHEVNVKVPGAKLGEFYAMIAALHGSTSVPALARGHTAAEAARKPAEEKAKDPEPQGGASGASGADAGSGGGTAGDASGDDGVDAGGHAWNADLHASTKSKTGEGLWRMKPGKSRPDHLPGSPAAVAKDAPNGGIGTANGGAASTGSGSTAPGTAGTADAGTDDDDEFAAFAKAAAASNETDAKAAASVPARKWTDADLGKLTNQAAVKLGDPAPVKALIAKHVGEGNVAHSRNIPEDKREAFAQDVEKTAGITFEG